MESLAEAEYDYEVALAQKSQVITRLICMNCWYYALQVWITQSHLSCLFEKCIENVALLETL